MKTTTSYVIVNDDIDAKLVSHLLDDEYTLVISWVVGKTIHHILSKEISND